MTDPARVVASGKEIDRVRGAAALSKAALSGANLLELGAEFHARATSDPEDSGALMDLSTVLYLIGDSATANAVQTVALREKRLYRLDTVTTEHGPRLLVIMAPGDPAANTPIDYLVFDSDVRVDFLYVVPGLPPSTSLPDCDVVFVAIGEADETRQARQLAEAMLHTARVPVLNPAKRIAAVARDQASELLCTVPGAVVPRVRRLDLAALRNLASLVTPIATLLPDGGFPILIRPVGSHAGKGLAKLDTPEEVTEYLENVHSNEFYVSRFVDYRSPSGFYEKARLVLIQGRPLVCHLAVNEHWLVHYQTAKMNESAAKRSAEERFMAGFESGFVRKHGTALSEIAERMNLDYLVIDCGETRDGQLLIFEVDTNALVHALDPVDLFAYKQPVMQKVFSAFRAMLENASGRGAPRS